MKKLKIGIIGVGRLGYEHACNIANRVPGSELVAIADANFDRAKQVAEELGVTAVYNDPKALCADPNVEAVAIITNTASHVETEIVGTRSTLRIVSVPTDSPVEVMSRYGICRVCYTAFLFHIQFILYYFIFKSPNRIQI